jgi:MFS transporter, DHA1 family, tetracycline resistance protein
VSAGTRQTILFLTVFVDLVGFGIVLPLLPLYAETFGSSGTAIGVLVLSFSAAQLVFAPIWGRLSDRFGRRPILLIGLVGSALSYALFAFAGTFWLLLLSRVLAGIGGANVPVAQAYIADITPPARRAQGMGLLGAAFGMGFIFGPAIGGLLAPISSAAPGLAAAALCGGNAILAFFLLPESLGKEERQSRADRPRATAAGGGWRDFVRSFQEPGVATILGLSFLFIAAFSVMHPVFPLLARDRFGFDARSVGWLFTYLGTVSALMQGLIIRKLAPRLGEIGLIRFSALPFVAGLFLIAAATEIPLLLLGLTLLAVGFGGTLPALSSLLSQAADDDVQGAALGAGQSIGAMARMAGPLLGGFMWDVYPPMGPFLVGGAIALLAASRVFLSPLPTQA